VLRLSHPDAQYTPMHTCMCTFVFCEVTLKVIDRYSYVTYCSGSNMSMSVNVGIDLMLSAVAAPGMGWGGEA